METSPEEEERLHKEKERLERELETSKYLREQERKGAEYDKEIIKDNNSKTIGYLRQKVRGSNPCGRTL
jgi:hypothetical protein